MDRPETTATRGDKLRVAIVRKAFVNNGAELKVLEDVRFDCGEGEFISLLGPSGCGKTTLLRLIAGLDTEYEGHIRLGTKHIGRPSREFGVVFQESRLLPWLTVARNLDFALPDSLPSVERASRIQHVLELVGLTEFHRAFPYQLSGGMEKRVALARALVNVPRVLLLDEPFGALDAYTRFALQDELNAVHQEEGNMTVLVTHDVDEAVYLSDRVAVLTAGPARIKQLFNIELPRPRDRAAADFAAIRSEILELVLHTGRQGEANS